MDITALLANEFSIKLSFTQNIISLIDEGNTIPFIARYRKEQTGSIDDQMLRNLYDRLNYLRNLYDRKQQVVNLLTEQGNFNKDIEEKLEKALTLAEVEDIYRPFKPKRRTRATVAQEKGLLPLASILWEQEIDDLPEVFAAKFVNEEKGVLNVEDALLGACDILAEKISDNPSYRAIVRKLTYNEGIIESLASKKTKEDCEQTDSAKKADTYALYFEFSQSIKQVADHRVLALNRGENEGFLKVDIAAPSEKIFLQLEKVILKNNKYTVNIIKSIITDSYKRLIAPSIEREMRTMLTEKACESAIKVFGENLRQLLMQPPIKGNAVLSIDPGFRTGCKWAILDKLGSVLDVGVVYCTIGKDTANAKCILNQKITQYGVSIIAIGNGTAARETEIVVVELLREYSLSAKYIIVNEAGASVYSASKLAADEFPDFDVSLRSAVSIGRRLQDPLAELVKIDPKSIGVGLYQHDMEQKRLGYTLGGVVEACVNAVGVNLNTASASLLSYVAGINPTIANNILEYRQKIGEFSSRKELLKVKKLGPKTFEQAAGFLRIPNAKNQLDNTGVHPESYKIAQDYLKETEKDSNASIKDIAKTLCVGLPTLVDIATDLKKPGRDPREQLPKPILRSDILSMQDLQEGMVLKGEVRNIIDFGAFVDIGVHQDGLVHVSEIAERFIKHPLEVLSIGDIVSVKVLDVDVLRKRISLSIKQA